MQLLDMSRSIARAIMVDPDKNEKAERLAMQFSGVADAWDRISIRLCAAAEVPVTKMLGRSPAGLNATGDSDTRNWYDTVAAYQRNVILPRLERLLRITKRATRWEKSTSIKFPSLWQESPGERADRRLKTSQADSLDVTARILSAEEVARSRYGGASYSAETKLIEGARPGGTVLPDHGAPAVSPVAGPNAVPAPAFAVTASTSSAASGIPGSDFGPPMVDRQAKPGQGRLPPPQGPTLGNPWPQDMTKPEEKD
jgi:hypothetical protein